MTATPELEQLYDDHAQALFAFLLNLTRSEADTRDLMQEVFGRLARHPNQLDQVRDQRAYLLRMAHNLWIDQVRRHAHRERVREELAGQVQDLFAPTSDPDARAFRRELGVALEELPAEQRAVVHLKLWEDLTFEAISQALAIPLNTAASRYRYGLDKLRARLRPLYEEIQ